MDTILFPTDFSTNTQAPMAWARLFARKTNATLTLLHVFQPIATDTTLPTLGDPGVGVAASMEVEDLSRRRLEQIAEQLKADGITVEVDWRVGSVEEEILEAARRHQADLIVMGRSELNTFFDRLAGSAVTGVVGEAPCPILIVPTPAEHEVVWPAQVRTIIYAMQPQTQHADVAKQTDELVEVFEARLDILTEDQLEHAHPDLIVMQLYPQPGMLDRLLNPNHIRSLVEKSDVPVLVYPMES